MQEDRQALARERVYTAEQRMNMPGAKIPAPAEIVRERDLRVIHIGHDPGVMLDVSAEEWITRGWDESRVCGTCGETLTVTGACASPGCLAPGREYVKTTREVPVKPGSSRTINVTEWAARASDEAPASPRVRPYDRMALAWSRQAEARIRLADQQSRRNGRTRRARLNGSA